MYNWRKMTGNQRAYVLRLRKVNRIPWHSPPHRSGEHKRYHITSACYEHKPIIGQNEIRMTNFESQHLAIVKDCNNRIFAWTILPNHYHLLIWTEDILKTLKRLGRFHGRSSYDWNGEEETRGRKVWCNTLEHAIKSDRHFWATINYIHHNPVHHGYVKRWQDWPFSSATDYLNEFGHDKARKIWKDFPILDYGKEWDPSEM